MSEIPKVCVDRVLPKDLMRFQPTLQLAGRTSAISPIGKTWMNGSTLRVRFMGGTAEQHAIVREQAGWWSQAANLKFDFNNAPAAEIRISFDPNEGAWSYVGTDCQYIPLNQATMNLGFTDFGTAAHEIGHCLAGDTLIDCPRDLEKYPKGIPIKDLVGQQPWVYAWKDGKIVVRKASRVWLTKIAETVRVTLRPGKGKKRTATYFPPQELVGTTDHPVLLSDGKTWRNLGELHAGDRLCSLYRHKAGKRTALKWTNGPKGIQEHVFVCEELYGSRPESHHSHHKNKRMLDQCPENLEWKHEKLHRREHAIGRTRTAEARLKISAAVKKRYADGTIHPMLGKHPSDETKLKISSRLSGRTLSKEHSAKISRARAGFRYSLESRMRMSVSAKARTDQVRNERGRFLPSLNHVVVSVEPAGVQDVYDMTVPDADSFVANGVVVHNSIGLHHEHSSPFGGIVWNEPFVISELAKAPNFWSEETTRHNVFRKYSVDQVNGTVFDPDSIMLYAFPASWTLNGVSTKSNEVLSAMDKAFVAGAKMYPKLGGTPLTAKLLKVNHVKRTEAAILKFGEEHLFKFRASSDSTHVIDTQGPTNVVMKLFGPNSETALIAEDDDSGIDANARISASLIRGYYFVQVRHYNQYGGTGTYSISVNKASKGK